MFSVKEKRVIVTGGARGIGSGDVRTLVANGSQVAIFDILDDLGENLAAEVSAMGPGKAMYYHVDISRREAVFSAVPQATADLGGLDSLHNVAGIERVCSAEDITESELEATFNVNVKGMLYTAQAVFPHFRAQGSGTILNCGSDAGLHPVHSSLSCSASKGAVHSLTRGLAAEWGKYGIRVNAFLPFAQTPLVKAYLATLSQEEALGWWKMVKQIPLGREGSITDDIAPVLLFLTSDASKYITGQLISVNGGGGMVR